MPIDLSTFDTATRSAQGVKMIIRKPGSNEPFLDENRREAYIVLRGRNSPQFLAVKRKLDLEAATRRKFAVDMTDEDRQRETAEYLTACTVEFGNLTNGANPLEATPENCNLVWSDQRWEWLHRQAEAFIATDLNFLASASAA